MTAARVPAAGDVGLQGHYAGFVSRFGAFVIDVLVIALTFALAGTVTEYVVDAVGGGDFHLSDWPLAGDIILAAWAFFYSAYSLASAGKTLGLAIVGLRAVRRDGRELSGWRAVVRVLAFPLSFAVFCFGFLMILIGRERRALHDVIADTAVVYAWDARAAHLRFLAKRTRTS